MKYKDQLVLTGMINDVGAYTRTNIPDSYRSGVEVQASLQPVDWFKAGANVTLSENKVKHFTEYIDDYDNGGQKLNTYSSGDIALSPNLIGGTSWNMESHFQRSDGFEAWSQLRAETGRGNATLESAA